MIHELKCWPGPFAAILRGEKRHEIRMADRPYAVGDTLRLREYSPAPAEYSGREAEVLVTHITPGGSWGLPPELCAMSIVLVVGER